MPSRKCSLYYNPIKRANTSRSSEAALKKRRGLRTINRHRPLKVPAAHRIARLQQRCLTKNDRGPTTITGHTTLKVDIEAYQTKHARYLSKLSRQRFFFLTRQVSTEPMPEYDTHPSIDQTIATAKVLNILQPVSSISSDDQTQHIYQQPNPTHQRHPLF